MILIYARFYLKNDEIIEINDCASFDPMYKKINDHELATVTMKSKKGVICVITNSRRFFGYDQRGRIIWKKGMLISGNKKINETEISIQPERIQQTF